MRFLYHFLSHVMMEIELGMEANPNSATDQLAV